MLEDDPQNTKSSVRVFSFLSEILTRYSCPHSWIQECPWRCFTMRGIQFWILWSLQKYILFFIPIYHVKYMSYFLQFHFSYCQRKPRSDALDQSGQPEKTGMSCQTNSTSKTDKWSINPSPPNVTNIIICVLSTVYNLLHFGTLSCSETRKILERPWCKRT